MEVIVIKHFFSYKPVSRVTVPDKDVPRLIAKGLVPLARWRNKAAALRVAKTPMKP